jgi:hypothetical protein
MFTDALLILNGAGMLRPAIPIPSKFCVTAVPAVRMLCCAKEICESKNNPMNNTKRIPFCKPYPSEIDFSLLCCNGFFTNKFIKWYFLFVFNGPGKIIDDEFISNIPTMQVIQGLEAQNYTNILGVYSKLMVKFIQFKAFPKPILMANKKTSRSFKLRDVVI